MAQVILYARIDQARKDWLEAVARDAGVSASSALDAILAEAMSRNWTLRTNPAQVIQP